MSIVWYPGSSERPLLFGVRGTVRQHRRSRHYGFRHSLGNGDLTLAAAAAAAPFFVVIAAVELRAIPE